MIYKITTKNDIIKINNNFVREYIRNLIEYLLKEYQEYCTDGSISSIGAIFYVEKIEELEQYSDFGLSTPIIKSDFEWVDNIGNGYSNGCIVLSADTAINIIAVSSIYKKFLEGK